MLQLYQYNNIGLREVFYDKHCNSNKFAYAGQDHLCLVARETNVSPLIYVVHAHLTP